MKAYGHSTVPWVARPLVGIHLKDWGWSVHLNALRRKTASKGVDPNQLYLRFSGVPHLEAAVI